MWVKYFLLNTCVSNIYFGIVITNSDVSEHDDYDVFLKVKPFKVKSLVYIYTEVIDYADKLKFFSPETTQ